MSTSKQSFWSSLPGVVTGIAGVLTAVVGLGALLVSLGVIGDKSSTPTTGSGATSETPGATNGANGSSASAGGKPSFDVDPRDVSFTLSTKTATLKVTNEGSVKLKLKTPDIDGPQQDQFEVSAGPCTKADVPAGGSCSLTVTFKGGLATEAKATMTVTADDADPVEVDLTGKVL